MNPFSFAERRARLTSIAVAGGVSALIAVSGAAADIPGKEYQIYSGSTHAHTEISWSHGEQWEKAPAAAKGEKGGGEAGEGGLRVSPEGVQGPPPGAKAKPNWEKENQGPPAAHYARAKAAHYDFYTVTDHSQEEKLSPVSATNPTWVESKKAAAAATDASFVALLGYEHSENNGPGGKGHLNVINSAEYLNALAPGNDLPKLYKWLKTVPSAGDGPVVAVFNHPGPHQYNDFADRDDGVTEVLTMLEVINSNKNVHFAGWLAALDKGWKVAPVCGNDNHGFFGITRHTSRTFVLATARTKAAILDAMKNRRTYASFEQNIECRYTVNGAIMGSTLRQPKDLKFNIYVNDPDVTEAKDKITKIDIVTDGGKVVEAYEPGTPAHTVTWAPTIKNATGKYYLVRVWNAGGGDLPEAQAKPDQPMAWLAPVWTGR